MVFQFIAGLLLGFFISAVVLVFMYRCIQFLIYDGDEPPEAVSTAAVVLAAVSMLLLGIRRATNEVRSQLRDYNEAHNRCQQCGYKLTGIRQIANRCPECGELFKRL